MTKKYFNFQWSSAKGKNKNTYYNVSELKSLKISKCEIRISEIVMSGQFSS